jgi:lysophospholipase L1-like esterase
MFAGDSNTSPSDCDYPRQWQATRDPTTWASVNEGIFGSAAFGWIRDGTLLARLAADQPDRVVIALGTNDLGNHRSPGHVVADLWTLYRQVETFRLRGGRHPVAYVATIPPVYVPAEPGDPTAEEAARLRNEIAATNVLIRLRVPKGRVIDFDSWMPAQWTAGIMRLPNDGVHLGCDGHAARARAVGALL